MEGRLLREWGSFFFPFFTYHAVEFMEDTEPGQIAPFGELNGFLPMEVQFGFGNTDAHVSHQIVPCCVGFERRGTGEWALVEFGVELGFVFDGQAGEHLRNV